MVKMKVKRLYPDASLPFKKNPEDEGWDLFVHSISFDEQGNIVYGTGIAIELDKGYWAEVKCRSSNAKYDLVLTNGTGTIDNPYRGEIMTKFKPTPRCTEMGAVFLPLRPKTYEIGDRFAQLVIHRSEEVEMEEVDELSETSRGTGGYGSTGR